ncbi:MAG TPA: alpha-2-macroglobulin family protein, partial [Actinomycetota bacterium]|nr:alpha-2-macroglobulin family protein [Actinomycetota bacterium]
KQSLFARSEASELMDGAADFGGGGGGGDDATPRGAGFVEPTVRKNFADTALWVANLGVKDDGVAEVELDMPENLTTWKARVWVMSAGTRVGQGQAEIVTAKDLIVRLQAPRFFVQKDEVVLSANVHNYLKSPKRAEVTLQLEGGCLEPLVGEGKTGGLVNEPNLAASTLTQTVHVEPGGEQRVDFRVRVASPGSATVRMLARTDEESDATQMSFPVYVHGMLKTESFAGAIRPSASAASVSFTVPQERIPEQSRVEIRYSPSVAGAMVDALPYLTDFPYGCTEQTLNRFLPTVITQRVLIAMGLNLKDIAAKRTNLNAQEIGDDRARAAARQNGTRLNPVFDEAVVLAMTRAGVTKLANQQLPDGGWGWFSGYGEQSGPHTTATVVHGLQIARANDVALPPGVLERGVEWLKLYEARQVQMLKNAPGNVSPSKNASDNLDAFVFMVLSDAGHVNGDMREFLYRDRSSLSVYCLAQLGLALHRQKGQEEKLAMVLRNLSQYVVQDEENQTAYLKLPESGRYWWYWYGSDTEANAYYLKLLAKTDGKGELPARLAKYLVNSRRNASYWNSTRDTALCVEALADFIAASGEGKPDMKVAVQVDGKVVKEVAINAANLFSFDNKVVLEGPEVTPGAHRIEFTRTGTGPLYFNAYVTNFTLEEPITKAGLEIRVQRKYYRL